MNVGITGWTTAETLVNYFLVVQDLSPDIVLIHEAVNDAEPRVGPAFGRITHTIAVRGRIPNVLGLPGARGAFRRVHVSELQCDAELADVIPVTRSPDGPFVFGDGGKPLPGTEETRS